MLFMKEDKKFISLCQLDISIIILRIKKSFFSIDSESVEDCLRINPF